MSTLESLKNRLIDRILVTKNEKLLAAIESIFTSTQKDETLNLTSEQIGLSLNSVKDIESGYLISESDSEWMSRTSIGPRQ